MKRRHLRISEVQKYTSLCLKAFAFLFCKWSIHIFYVNKKILLKLFLPSWTAVFLFLAVVYVMRKPALCDRIANNT